MSEPHTRACIDFFFRRRSYECRRHAQVVVNPIIDLPALQRKCTRDTSPHVCVHSSWTLLGAEPPSREGLTPTSRRIVTGLTLAVTAALGSEAVWRVSDRAAKDLKRLSSDTRTRLQTLLQTTVVATSRGHAYADRLLRWCVGYCCMRSVSLQRDELAHLLSFLLAGTGALTMTSARPHSGARATRTFVIRFRFLMRVAPSHQQPSHFALRNPLPAKPPRSFTACWTPPPR